LAVAISRIRNDTQLRINPDELVRKIRIDLRNAGVTRTVTSIGLDGPEDPMTIRTRELRQSREFDQRTVPARGQMVAQALSLSGVIIQRNNRVGGGAMRIDYIFSLAVIDSRTGIAIWEGERVISRRTSDRTVGW
jgi:PBP1b-binding outer membrane lipoprotein LpoB